MQAIQILTPGTADALVLRDLPTPTPGPGEALIRIEASGVNFIDIYFREGRYPAPLPLTLGQEAAGIIVALGEHTTPTTFKVGDRVAWCSIAGTYAQLAVAPTARLILIPEAVSSQQAAAAMLQGMTAHYLSHSTYPIQPGDEILIHAGAGGVGLLFIQMAKSLGARVFTTVSTDEKADLAKAAGADEVIFYTQEDFAAKVKKLASGPGLQAVYDSVGKSTFDKSLEVLRPRGTMVLFGGSSGAVPPFDPIRLSILGSLYLTRPKLQDYTCHPSRTRNPRQRRPAIRSHRKTQAPPRTHLPTRRRGPRPSRPRVPQDHRQTSPHPLAKDPAMKPITSTNILLSIIALLLFAIAIRPFRYPEPVQAQSSTSNLFIEPGVHMLRAPDNRRQVLGKVVVDLRSGRIWGFPTNGPQPYPMNTDELQNRSLTALRNRTIRPG